jgi:GNAT superfamily N-acetyltransferase
MPVRRLTEDDWATLRALRIAALTDAPDAFGSNLERELAFDEETWRARLKQTARVTIVMEKDGEPIGLAGGVQEGHEAELVSMWVAPAARGKGVAAALIGAVLAWAAGAGCRRISLWVTAGNDPAYALYLAQGFTPTGEREPLPDRPRLEELRMRRDLP